MFYILVKGGTQFQCKNNKGGQISVHMNQEHKQGHPLIPPKCQEMSQNCEKVYIFEYITIFIFIIFWETNKGKTYQNVFFTLNT